MELEAYGFTEVGRWTLSGRGKSGISFNLHDLADERVVYAFVVDGVPKYIGICEKNTTTLKARMERYKNLQGGSARTESTNQRIARLIKQHLTEGQVVHILAVRPTAIYSFVDLEVDLIKGLENPLIGKFDPEWNK